jgi:hypothetical protein
MVLWLAVAATGSFAVSSALDGRSHQVALIIGIECWSVWAVTWVALLVPRATTLTIARLGVPTGVVAAIVALAAGAPVTSGATFAAVAVAALAALVHGSTVDAFVDGSSYGPEERFALRIPPLLAVTAVPATWLVATSLLWVPVLAAAQLVIPALAVLVCWVVGVRPALRSLHLLARRWVVFVPAGMVLSDPLVLADAILLPRRNVDALGPAVAGTDATDLTQGALGLALQADLDEPFGLGLRQGRGATPRELATDRILFAACRPGALLEAATTHRVAVGETLVDAGAPSCVGGHQHPGDASADPATESQTAVPLPRTRSPR